MCPCLSTIVVVLNQHYKYCVEMPSKENYQHWMQRDGILDNWQCISMSWMVKMSLIETTYYFWFINPKAQCFCGNIVPSCLIFMSSFFIQGKENVAFN
jgi:hypothetical protein